MGGLEGMGVEGQSTERRVACKVLLVAAGAALQCLVCERCRPAWLRLGFLLLDDEEKLSNPEEVAESNDQIQLLVMLLSAGNLLHCTTVHCSCWSIDLLGKPGWHCW